METFEIEKDTLLKLESEINDERDRLSTDRMDISFGELINLYKNKELIINPDYQRMFRWDIKKQTALIESLLLSIPVPPIFVAEDDNGIWELVDGLQRVSTFLGFFGELSDENIKRYEIDSEDTNENINDDNIYDDDDYNENNNKELSSKNKWKLQKGGLIPSLEGFDIDTLPTKYKINLKRAVCRVEILRGKSNVEMKYELFKRLNSGGAKLTPQEIRNAIYRSENPEIIEAVVELSNNQTFKKYTNLSRQKKEELYDQELVLRFFAYLNNIANINQSTEQFLNNFLEKNIKNTNFDITFYKIKFQEVMEIINCLGDEGIFRNKGNLFVPAYFEGITIGLAENIEKYIGKIDKVRDSIEKLKKDEKFKKVSGTASNSKTRSKARLLRVSEIFSEREI